VRVKIRCVGDRLHLNDCRCGEIGGRDALEIEREAERRQAALVIVGGLFAL
jgi:hypothetical protein